MGDCLNILYAVIAVGAIGVLCGIVLAVASRFLTVKVDERVARLTEILPGVNCGACGFSGCGAYAHALVFDAAPANACPPGGAAAARAIGEILGVSVEDVAAKLPVVYCMGDFEARLRKIDYSGVNTCAAAKLLYGGPNACAYGCMGLGDCLAACKFGALCLDSGLPRVDAGKCTGCMLCQTACPNNIIVLEELDGKAFVGCRNTEKGAVVRKKCSAGCIACTKCVRECPEKAISMLDNLARVDAAKCVGCGKCVEVCVTKCVGIRNEVPL